MKRPYYSNFADQKRNAKKRNIPFNFTYETWLDWWGEDIINRGKCKGQLVMARYNDIGEYHPDNVFKCEASANVVAGNIQRPCSAETRAKRSKSVSDAWKTSRLNKASAKEL